MTRPVHNTYLSSNSSGCFIVAWGQIGRHLTTLTPIDPFASGGLLAVHGHADAQAQDQDYEEEDEEEGEPVGNEPGVVGDSLE